MARHVKCYAPLSDIRLIGQAAKASGAPSVSSFIRGAAVAKARETLSRVYCLPDSEEYQRQMILRAMRNGAFAIDDLMRQTGLDQLALKCSLGELAAAGQVEERKGPRRKELIYVLIDQPTGNGKS